jgi:3-isopropylmalate/(R)-2-methylmalate dehydratase large subunit
MLINKVQWNCLKNLIDWKIIYTLQANPDYKGVCHVALAQEGHCRPGEVINS